MAALLAREILNGLGFRELNRPGHGPFPERGNAGEVAVEPGHFPCHPRRREQFARPLFERRRAIARIYDERLRDLEELLLPPGPDGDDARYDVFQNYEVEAERRGELREALAQAGVGTIIQWGGHMIHQFEKLGLRANAPYAEAMSSRYLLLPIHHLLSDDEVHFACDQIRSFYRR